MPFTVTMPKLSPTMEEGVIAKWNKKEGEFVEAGEVLLEITTDKATVEHTAFDEGWLRKILVKEGELVKLNQPIAIFSEQKNESIENYQPEGIIPPPIAEPAKVEAIAAEQQVPEKPRMQFIEPAFEPEPPLQKEALSIEKKKTERIAASPLAKQLAKEQGLDLSTVKGTGPGGRITSRDLEKAQPATLVAFGRHEIPAEVPGSYVEIPLSPIRKIIAKRLQSSKSFIPHFYVKQVIDAMPLFQFREQLKQLGLKPTFNDMIIRACAIALREHTDINSGFNSVNQTIIQFKTIDISVAVEAENGLITPVIRHADYKDLGEISLELRGLIERARKGKLKEQEYKGGSFCVSNLGMFGITEFTAVINPPQSAILAVGGIEDAPVVKNGVVVAGKTLSLILSVDHRVVDGAAAAQFLKKIQHLLENPASLAI